MLLSEQQNNWLVSLLAQPLALNHLERRSIFLLVTCIFVHGSKALDFTAGQEMIFS